MPYLPVAGVDYLIDHYQILGVDRTATKKDITAVWRTKVKQYHPDKMHGLAPELISSAEHKLSLINEAYTALGNRELRTAYDEVLGTWTKPISTDGRAIIDLTGASGFSFTGLLEQISQTDETHEVEAEKIAKDLSGFNPATYEFFKSQAESEAGIPEGMLPAYLEQLQSRNLYLEMKEGFIWDKLGFTNFEPKGVLAYAHAASVELERVRELANASLESELELLTTGEKTLLPAPEPGASGALIPAELFAYHNERITEHFAVQEKHLKTIVQEREVVLRQIFESGSEMMYHPDVSTYTDLLVVEIVFPSQTVRLCFKLTAGHAEGLEVEGLESLSNPDTARAWINDGYTIVSFKPQGVIDTKDELGEVISRHGALLFSDNPN